MNLWELDMIDLKEAKNLCENEGILLRWQHDLHSFVLSLGQYSSTNTTNSWNLNTKWSLEKFGTEAKSSAAHCNLPKVPTVQIVNHYFFVPLSDVEGVERLE